MVKGSNIVKQLLKKHQKNHEVDGSASYSSRRAVIFKNDNNKSKRLFILIMLTITLVATGLIAVKLVSEFIEKRNYTPSREQQMIDEFKPEPAEIYRYEIEE